MSSIPRRMEAEKQVEPDYLDRTLSEHEVAAGRHRKWVGGKWHKMGKLQLDFLLAQGLQPDHRFVDVGCGSLRAGRLLVDYLHPGNLLWHRNQPLGAAGGLRR